MNFKTKNMQYFKNYKHYNRPIWGQNWYILNRTLVSINSILKLNLHYEFRIFYRKISYLELTRWSKLRHFPAIDALFWQGSCLMCFRDDLYHSFGWFFVYFAHVDRQLNLTNTFIFFSFWCCYYMFHHERIHEIVFLCGFVWLLQLL